MKLRFFTNFSRSWGVHRIFAQWQAVSSNDRCRGGIDDASPSLLSGSVRLLTGVINAAPTMPLEFVHPRCCVAVVYRSMVHAEDSTDGSPA